MEIDAKRLWYALNMLKRSGDPTNIELGPEPGIFRCHIRGDKEMRQYDGSLDAVATIVFESARKQVKKYLEKTEAKFKEYQDEVQSLRTTFNILEGTDDTSDL